MCFTHLDVLHTHMAYNTRKLVLHIHVHTGLLLVGSFIGYLSGTKLTYMGGVILYLYLYMTL